tara:strand:+ start:68 stop:415 length:348 start_codon:yes stop_codon:yes gene_type:complete
MAKIERLNKRVKKIEQWIAENEDMGGPKGYLDTMVSLYQDAATSQQQAAMINDNFNRLKAFNNEFLALNELGEEWNKFLEEKDNAVREQQTEEVSVQEQAEGGEETSEAPEEEKE